MVGSGELTFEDAFSYITALKDEPTIFQEFSKLLTDYRARRLDSSSLIANVEEKLLKDHQMLLHGFGVFHHKAKPSISPEANTMNPLEAMIATIPEAKRITYGAESNVEEELLKDHQMLLPGLGVVHHKANPSMSPEANTITPSEAMITVIPKAKRTTHGADSKCSKTRRDLDNFLDKLKTRFGTVDTHVVESFCEIMNKFHEGRMSEKEAYHEVIDVIYYHEDLRNDFSRFLRRSYSYIC